MCCAPGWPGPRHGARCCAASARPCAGCATTQGRTRRRNPSAATVGGAEGGGAAGNNPRKASPALETLRPSSPPFPTDSPWRLEDPKPPSPSPPSRASYSRTRCGSPRTSPRGSCPPPRARAVSHIVASPVADHPLDEPPSRPRTVATNRPASRGRERRVANASALFERARVDLDPRAGVEREGYDGELAACVDAVASASVRGEGRPRVRRRRRDYVIAIVASGEEACGANLRASALRTLRMSVAAKPALVSALPGLLPHAGSRDVADALIACLHPVFAPKVSTFTEKRRRLGGGDEVWTRGGESGAGPSSAAAWVEECIVSALHQLSPMSLGGSARSPGWSPARRIGRGGARGPRRGW